MPSLVGAEISGSVIRQPLVSVELITKDKESGSTVLRLAPVPEGLSYYDTIIADAPVWYPRLGELSGTTAVDDIGVLNADGQYVGTPTLGVVGIPGIADNTAVSFDSAIPEYAHLFGDTGDFKFIHTIGVFTIEMWMKSGGVGVDEMLMGNINLASATTKGFGVRFHSNDWIGLTVTTAVNNVYVYNFITANNIISDTTSWHHILITSDGVNGFIYVDAVQQATASMGGLTTGNATGIIALASGAGAPFKPFKGGLDEPAIYDTFFTASQVLAHRNAGI